MDTMHKQLYGLLVHNLYSVKCYLEEGEEHVDEGIGRKTKAGDD